MTTTKALAEALTECKRLADACPELNLSNYDPDDVDELNAWAIEVAQAIDALHDAQAAEQAAGGEAVAWMDDGTKVHNGPGKPAYRVITAETKRNMPRSVQAEYTIPLGRLTHPAPAPAPVQPVGELPPLPIEWRKVEDADGIEVPVFRAFQMWDYARAAIAAFGSGRQV